MSNSLIKKPVRGFARELEVGFPEFESFHLADFSTKAQFSKSVASTIPPRPLSWIEFYFTTKWNCLQHPTEILIVPIEGDKQ